MEKLNIKFLKLVAITVVAMSSSAALAGGFRLSSKAPVIQKQHHKHYFFGYGGIDLGAQIDTTGNFHIPGYFEYDDAAMRDVYIENPRDIRTDFDLETGATFGGGFGFFSNLFGGSRFELEGSHTSNRARVVTYGGPSFPNDFELEADFHIKTNAAFFNMLKEVRFDSSTAYFGGGLGFAQSHMDGHIAGVPYDDTDSGFAYQLIAGMDFPINDCLSFYTQYRYMVLSDLSFTTGFGDYTNVTDSKPSSHAVLFGLRVSF